MKDLLTLQKIRAILAVIPIETVLYCIDYLGRRFKNVRVNGTVYDDIMLRAPLGGSTISR